MAVFIFMDSKKRDWTLRNGTDWFLGKRGSRIFLGGGNEQRTCILSGWNLTLILDPRSRFSRKPKDLLFEEVTIRSISTEGWLTMHMLWSTSSLLYIPRDNLMIYNVKTLKVYLLIYIFFHLFVYYSAFGLKCYGCRSTKSMDDCRAKQKEVNCSSSNKHCVTESFEYKIIIDIKTYTKGCQYKSYCDSEFGKKICEQANGKNCEATCCEGDLCNTSLVPAASILLMVSCALVVFLSIKPWAWSLIGRAASVIQCD